ncbi:uncharacterized protein STEHIDRAFT_164342 [Stereum hirsutum FP-91666 SS1]|uniref:uncharacterized protein n=1 Tax=Stereum hirsutum (strain FP-91666) TaxID=721885 RepID=UPI000440DE82|nr:uncharacterized protein STEHIDRAFT_164342 [Stereum hirsutum FP-91666 SS1]EIM91931.1 hypothetical protein STEHIDRAFT_164342 [Stereum hirsutum FP-91666 SS1]
MANNSKLVVPEVLEIPSSADPTKRIRIVEYDHYPCDSLHLEQSKLIHTANHVDIYRAVARDPPSDCDGDVVYKVAYGPAVVRLRHEAQIYRKLVSVQGARVPICYGYFEGDDIACLVLQYCGEPRPEAFDDLPPEAKKSVIAAFWAVHKLGVDHGDPAPRNIVYKHNRGYLIDFEHASDTHTCTAERPPLNSIAQSLSEFPCEELWHMLTDLGLWRPATIFYAGEYYPVNIMHHPEDLVKQAPAYWTREQAMAEVRKVAKEYSKRWLPETYERIYGKSDAPVAPPEDDMKVAERSEESREADSQSSSDSSVGRTRSKNKPKSKPGRKPSKAKEASGATSGVGSDTRRRTRPKPVPVVWNY